MKTSEDTNFNICRIHNFPVSSNSFVISHEISKKCIIVDPGTESSELLIDYLNKNDLCLDYVVLTHEHIDHIIGLSALKSHYNFKLICSSACNQLLNNTRYNLSRFAEQFTPYSNFSQADITFDCKLALEWCSKLLLFYEAKGHSLGSIFFILGDFFFIGDTLIPGKPTVTTLPGGSKEDLLETFEFLKHLLETEQYQIFPGHFDEVPIVEFCTELDEYIRKLKIKLHKY